MTENTVSVPKGFQYSKGMVNARRYKNTLFLSIWVILPYLFDHPVLWRKFGFMPFHRFIPISRAARIADLVETEGNLNDKGLAVGSVYEIIGKALSPEFFRSLERERHAAQVD